MSDYPNRFFTAPGRCANCAGKVGLGQSHYEWDGTEGRWLCKRGVVNEVRYAYDPEYHAQVEIAEREAKQRTPENAETSDG